MNWKAGELRFTVFVEGDVEASPGEWWEHVVQRDPDNFQFNTKVPSAIFRGDYGTGHLVLQALPGRIDWVYRPIDDPGEQQFIVGDLEESLKTFGSLIRRWPAALTEFPPLSRVALGTALRCPVEDRDSGYTFLQESLKDSVKLSLGSSDFLYRINRPRSVEVNSRRIGVNRVSEWSVIFNENHKASFTPPTLFTTSSTQQFFAQAALDINTSQNERTGIPVGDVEGWFSELVRMTEEIANFGDIP